MQKAECKLALVITASHAYRLPSFPDLHCFLDFVAPAARTLANGSDHQGAYPQEAVQSHRPKDPCSATLVPDQGGLHPKTKFRRPGSSCGLCGSRIYLHIVSTASPR